MKHQDKVKKHRKKGRTMKEAVWYWDFLRITLRMEYGFSIFRILNGAADII